MRVELSIEAHGDLDKSMSFYEAQRTGLGEYFLQSIESDLESLKSQGGIHQVVNGFHRKLSERFPFAIYYRVVSAVVDVIAILDCRREPDAIVRRLTERKQ